MARMPMMLAMLVMLAAVMTMLEAAAEEYRPLFDVPVHGPWIVHTDKSQIDHAQLTRHVHELYTRRLVEREAREEAHVFAPLKFGKSFTKAIHAMVVQGMTADELTSIPGVEYVYPDLVKHKAAYAWGQDRIDDISGLDNSYNPAYTGLSVDIYIIDTGCDTTHLEFEDNGSGRVVENVFSAYGDGDSADNDGDGHGTHVAGTAGGNTVGVASGANIYCMKVLSDEGSGFTSDIVDAIEEAMERDEDTTNRSVMNLSLGGACFYEYCRRDSIVKAIESAYEQGLVSSVAAGNCASNACSSSPAAAVNAITVKATTINDESAYFSNYGQCTDILAPGEDIRSACASGESGCGNGRKYVSLSGTSMAAPHVAGVAAQLFEKNPDATPDEVVVAMQCDAVKSIIDVGSIDTLTKNLFLQVPKNDGVFGTCDMGEGCEDSCNGEGNCLPAFIDASDGSTEDICHCDGDYYGDSCESTGGRSWPSYGNCPSSYGTEVTMTMSDSFGLAWGYGSFAIRDAYSNIVKGYALDSMCNPTYTSQSESRDYCLEEGCYSLIVTATGNNVGWQLCDSTGGGGYDGFFCITKSGNSYSCAFVSENELPTLAPTGSPAPSSAPTAMPSEPTASPTDKPTMAPTSAEPTTPPTPVPTTAISFSFAAEYVLAGMDEFGDTMQDDATLIIKESLEEILDNEADVTIQQISWKQVTKRRRLQDTEELVVDAMITVNSIQALGYGSDEADAAYDDLSQTLTEKTNDGTLTNTILQKSDDSNLDIFDGLDTANVEVQSALYPTFSPTGDGASSGSGDGMVVAIVAVIVVLVGCVIIVALVRMYLRKPSSQYDFVGGVNIQNVPAGTPAQSSRGQGPPPPLAVSVSRVNGYTNANLSPKSALAVMHDQPSYVPPSAPPAYAQPYEQGNSTADKTWA